MTPGAGIFRTQLPKGFLASGIHCGVRRYRPDLGLILSEEPCIAAGVFTQNSCKAAPVTYCQDILPANNIKAIITNSGQANAATGEQGRLDNLAMATCTAQALSCHHTQVLTASTGVIGEAMAIKNITQAIPELINNSTNIAEKFALSIMTTDLVPKAVYKEMTLSTGKITITGICKGSGMIHPNMATMLGYLLTDAKLSIHQAQETLTEITEESFNMISVDGETSTNDSVFMLANGASGVSLETRDDYLLFMNALKEIAITLAKSIARDGEGANKLIEVNVVGMPNKKLAKKVARSLTVSPLIKTAIYGESPNWGRVLARIGMEEVEQELLEKCSIEFQTFKVFSHGKPLNTHLQDLKKNMQHDTLSINIDFQSGMAQATAWGCDLSEKYIKINAEYVS